MKQDSLPADVAHGQGLAVALNDVSHLFNSPDVDPFSFSRAEALGVSGFEHLYDQLHLNKKLQQSRKVVLVFPAGKAPEFGAERITLALHRLAGFRIAEQQRMLRNTYRLGWRVSLIALGILAVCLAISTIFSSDLTEGMRPLIRKTFEYGFEIIGWVILWHPVDVLVFEPLAIRARIAALKTLASAEVVITTADFSGSV